MTMKPDIIPNIIQDQRDKKWALKQKIKSQKG